MQAAPELNWSKERVLFLTIIEQTIRDRGKLKRSVRQDAIELMRNNQDFRTICELAGL